MRAADVDLAFDLVLYNTNLPTVRHPGADAVAVRGGRIARVDSGAAILAEAGPSTRRLDLGGRTVIPGFNDAHAHVWKIGHFRTTLLDIRGVRSMEELAARVQAFSQRLGDGAWLLARGFNEAILREGCPPRRDDLDRMAPGRPVVVTRVCGHACTANSLALERAGIDADTAPPVGGIIEHDERGRPTGILHETAMGLVTRVVPPPTPDEYRAMIAAGLQHQLSLGITSSSDCGVPPRLLEVYREMEASGALPGRVNVMPLRRVDGLPAPVALPERFVSDRLRVDTVKFLADGGLSGATAALSLPYRHTAGRGILRFQVEELQELARESHAAGWRVAIHAIGDVAIDQVLGVYETLGPHPGGLAPRIEHFGLPDAGQIARAARLGAIAVPQPVFIHSLGRNFRQYLPHAFLLRTYPVRAMIDAGLIVALSSDAPVVEDDNPLVGLAAAVTRRDADGEIIAPKQAIGAAEALAAYTLGGALATGDEGNRGTLEPGKWADLAVLSGDPLAVEPEALAELRVEMTLLAGEVVYEA